MVEPFSCPRTVPFACAFGTAVVVRSNQTPSAPRSLSGRRLTRVHPTLLHAPRVCSSTRRRYPEDDLVGKLMAVASLMPIACIVCTLGAFFARRELWDLLTLLGIFCNEVLAQGLKHYVKEPRPPSCAAVDFCGTYGMPSSHAQLATFAATVATAQLLRRVTAAGAPSPSVDPMTACLVALSWPMAFAVGASRVYLGYHSLEQVLVGAVVGVAFGGVWHVVCCAASGAMHQPLADDSGAVGVLGALVGLRDSSLLRNPLAVERRALRDAAVAMAKKAE